MIRSLAEVEARRLHLAIGCSSMFGYCTQVLHLSEHAAYQCAFVGSEGRCTETAWLQYHHRIPFAEGGPTTVDNLELRCPAHNAYEADRWFGPALSEPQRVEGPLFVRETGSAWSLPTEARSAKVNEFGLDQVRPLLGVRGQPGGSENATVRRSSRLAPLVVQRSGFKVLVAGFRECA